MDRFLQANRMKVISQAPTRISLFGGGTDVEPYASKYGGTTFNFAINLRQKVIFGGKNKLLPNDNPDFFKAFQPKLKRIEHIFDGQIESGLGSSASLAVALVGAGLKWNDITATKKWIAEKAWDIEVNKLKLFGGKQDQYCSVHGGINLMEFGKDVIVTPLSHTFLDALMPNLVLFYTGRNRVSAKIQEGFKKLDDSQKNALDNIKLLTLSGVQAITSRDNEKVGRLLDDAWKLKKKSNKGVSNDFIDNIYATAIKSGAWGGKIMGAGGGGHILFVCEQYKQEELKNNLSKLGCTWIDFSIDFNGLETRII